MNTDYVMLTADNFKLTIEYEKQHQRDMNIRLAKYALLLDNIYSENTHHLMYLIRSFLQNEQKILLYLPLGNQELDALCLQGDAIEYTVLNSAKSKANINYNLCRTYCYHLEKQLQFNEPAYTIRPFFTSVSYEHPDNLSAIMFSNLLLMPPGPFRTMFSTFSQENRHPENTVVSVLAKLMDYFQVPYHAVLVRCYSLGLLDSEELLKELLQVNANRIYEEFHRLWLDESLLRPTMQNDFAHLEELVRTTGKSYVEQEYIKERTLNKALSNMKTLYAQLQEV